MKLKKMYSIRLPSALVAWEGLAPVFTHHRPRCIPNGPIMAALKSICSGEACRAFSGIGVSIRSRYAFSPASVVLSPFGAFPSSASRLLCVPDAFDWLLATAWVPLTSFIFILAFCQCPRCQRSLFLLSSGRWGIRTPESS